MYVGGCLVSGNEWMFEGSMNTGVKLTGALFGPVVGGYRGEYPTKEELELLEKAEPVLLSALWEDKIVIGTLETPIDEGVGRGLWGMG